MILQRSHDAGHMICRYWSNGQLIPLIVHLTFLLLFGVTSMHVQVSVTIVIVLISSD